MIDKTIKNIKKILYKVLEGLLTAKVSKKKNTLQGFEGDNYSKNSSIKNFYCFLYFLYAKGLDIKMAAITKETYENSSIEVITDNVHNLWLNESHVEK